MEGKKKQEFEEDGEKQGQTISPPGIGEGGAARKPATGRQGLGMVHE